MNTVGVELLEEKLADAPKGPAGENPAMLLSHCHQNAPSQVFYEKGSGKLSLRCTLCGEVYMQVLVARSMIVLPRGNGMG